MHTYSNAYLDAIPPFPVATERFSELKGLPVFSHGLKTAELSRVDTQCHLICLLDYHLKHVSNRDFERHIIKEICRNSCVCAIVCEYGIKKTVEFTNLLMNEDCCIGSHADSNNCLSQSTSKLNCNNNKKLIILVQTSICIAIISTTFNHWKLGIS